MAYYADKTVGSGKDYASLALFEDAYDHVDITGTDGVRARLTGICQTETYKIFAGWQAGQTSSCKIVITADAGEFTDGISDGGGAEINSLLYFTNGASYPLCVDIIGIEFSGRAGLIQFTTTAANNIYRVAKCLFVGTGATGQGIIFGSSGVTTGYIGGCVFRNFGSAYGQGINVNDSDVSVTVINNTFDLCYWYAVRRISGSIITKNNATINNATGDFTGTTETTNKSETDGQLTDDDADDFTEPSTYDYHVYNTDSALYEAGTAISDSWFTELCATDFDGTEWRDTPAIGAWEYVSGESTLSPIFYKKFTTNNTLLRR